MSSASKQNIKWNHISVQLKLKKAEKGGETKNKCKEESTLKKTAECDPTTSLYIQMV